jgi:lipopolysaccharide export system protein LptA
MNRAQQYLVAGVALAALVVGVPSALGQAGSRSQFGTIAVRASRLDGTLAGENLAVTLSGGVSVQTASGDIITSNTMAVAMDTNPVTKKTDAKTVSANGNVKLKTIQVIQPASGAAYKRVINASADKMVLNNFQHIVTLTGNVTVTADDPRATSTWRNAAKATLNLETKAINADAPNGQKMDLDIKPKG